ncbi:MAG: tetratricopeptide repeat protein, partial [Acidobacteriota bacterium]
EIADSRVAEDSVTYEDVRGIVGIGRERFEASRGALNTPDGYRDPVTHLIKILASTWTYHRIAARLLRQHRPEVSLVYYEGIDEVNHRFAQYLPPLMNQVRDVKPQLRAAYANAVPNFYRLQDRLIGELLEAADPNSVIMVVSDHGFANGGERPVKEPPDVDGKPGLWHRMDGVFIVAGPPVHPGRLRAPVQLLDVMPTVLALLDLPVAGDMPGHPVRDVFEAARGPESPAVEVTSYDAIGAPLESGGGTASVMDDEMMAKLTALGYIQAGADNGAETATYHVNSGHIFLQKHDLDRAHAEFARAREIAPNFDQPYLGLAQVEVMRGKLDRALPFIEKAITVVPAPQPALLTRAARIFAMAGRYDEGIAFLQSLPLEGREDAFRQAAMGMLHEKAGNTPEAMVAYKKALRLDPSVLPALRGLYALLRDGPLEELAEILQASLHAEQAVVAVRAANWLALSRERQGRTKEALEILRQAVRDDPDDLMTRTNLGSLLVNQDRPGEGLPHLERAQDLSPGSLEVQVNLIVAYGKLGDLDKARTQFEKARQGARDVDMPDVYNAIAYACFLNHAVRDASKFVDLSLGIKPGQKAALRLKDLIARAAGG